MQRGRKALLVSKVPLDGRGGFERNDTCATERAVKSGVPIRIGRVAKIFGEDTDKPFQALKEVSVDIDAGEFVSVVGPSGCGKSTLMLMVAGLLSRSQGDIAIGGKPVTSRSRTSASRSRTTCFSSSARRSTT